MLKLDTLKCIVLHNLKLRAFNLLKKRKKVLRPIYFYV